MIELHKNIIFATAVVIFVTTFIYLAYVLYADNGPLLQYDSETLALYHSDLTNQHNSVDFVQIVYVQKQCDCDAQPTPVTEPVTAPVTEPVTAPVTEPVTTSTDPLLALTI